MTDPITTNEVAARLDRLPVGRFHRRFLVLVSLGAWFDFFDNFVAGALVVLLVKARVLPQAEPGQWLSLAGLFMAALPLGMFLGTICFGMASDYLGRRLGFVLMLLVYSLASFAGGAGYYPIEALVGKDAALALLLVTRTLAGVGIGAENVIIDTYVSEMIPRQVRGRYVALVQAVAFTAIPVAFVLASVIRPPDWWLLPVVGSLGALFSWYFRRRLPESPRWLASVGRSEEAANVLAGIEAQFEGQAKTPVPPASAPTAKPLSSSRAPFRQLWSPRYRARTLLLVVFHLLQTVGYYGFMHWLPTLLTAKGLDTKEASFLPVLPSLLAPVGPLLAVWSCEHWQRKWLLVMLTLTVGLGLIGFGLTLDFFLLTLWTGALILGLNWFSAVFHCYQVELFPTSARATGVGFTYAWSRASMVVLNLIMPGLIALSLPATFGLMAGTMFAVAGTVTLFGPLTNAAALEE